jgi:hypothetical protein
VSGVSTPPWFCSGLTRTVCCGHLCNGVPGGAGLWRCCRLGVCRAVVGEPVRGCFGGGWVPSGPKNRHEKSRPSHSEQVSASQTQQPRSSDRPGCFKRARDTSAQFAGAYTAAGLRREIRLSMQAISQIYSHNVLPAPMATNQASASDGSCRLADTRPTARQQSTNESKGASFTLAPPSPTYAARSYARSQPPSAPI